MTAVFNNRIIFPTVADKKTYHFIKGITLPHEPIRFNNNNGQTLFSMVSKLWTIYQVTATMN